MGKFESNDMKPNGAHTRQRLIDAIVANRLYQTKCLLELVEDVNFVDKEGNSPLHCAAMIEDEKHRTRKEMLKLLIKNGADVNLPDRNGRHLLSWACLHNKEDIVHLLFRYSIQDLDLNMVDFEGNTALMHAVRSQNLNIAHKLVQSIVRFGLDIDLRNYEDCTAYLEARRLGFQECANMLVEDGHASKSILINPFLVGNDIETDEHHRELRDENDRRKLSPRINRILINPDMRRKHRIHSDITRSRDATLKRASARPKSSGTPRKLLVKRHGNETGVIVGHGSSSYSPRDEQTTRSDSRSKSVDMTDKGMGLILSNDTLMNHSASFASTNKSSSTSPMFNRGITRSSTNLHSHNPNPARRSMTAGANTRAGQNLRLNLNGVSGDFTRSKTSWKEMTSSRTLQRSRTLPASARSSCSDISAVSDSSSEMSWYSHFSNDNNPHSFLSLSNMQTLLQLYAVQASDTTSFRAGLPMPKSLPPEPKHAGDEDGHSEGGKSEDTPLSASSKRFAVVTRTVASYLQQKRNLTTIKVKDRIPGL